MLNNTKKIQVALIVVLVLLTGFLFSRDIKVLEAKENPAEASATADAAPEAPAITIEEASSTGKNLISNNLAKDITLLEGQFKKASGEAKIDLAKKLSQKWDDVEQLIPSALYLEYIATQKPSFEQWLKTGNQFQDAFETITEDEVLQNAVLTKANHAFKEAIAIDSTNLEAKTGLGITIVNGLGAPMEGIRILQEVVESDPKNLKANTNLGIFAIKSGQFDKAITRFNNIIQNIKASPEAYFYLATAYESLDQKENAVEAYLNSKKLAANPTLTKFIDQKVAELKK
ncbi:MAG: tetratricopeptide repeat protein [Pedobacter sp.]|nr:MAG: tetratricopeptide repeat protein [Pedobacter sp.]